MSALGRKQTVGQTSCVVGVSIVGQRTKLPEANIVLRGISNSIERGQYGA